MEVARLDTLVTLIGTGAYGEVHSLLVVRHGRLVLERYFGGWGPADLHPLYSVTKSITALLVGIAHDQGGIPGLDTPMLAFFPEQLPVANPSPWKGAITVGDLLTMRAGFEWDEFAAPYGDPANPTSQLSRSADWIRFVLSAPMAAAPGTAFGYNSGCSVLLGGIVRAASGSTAAAFAARRLFGPVGISIWDWQMGPQATTNTGWGLSLRPRDLARIGQLVLDGGNWRGRQIVSGDWIRLATTSHVTLAGGYGYGYQWWQPPLTSAGPVTLAWGWGDQFLFVVPQLDLVVVTTAGNYTPGSDDQALAFVPRYVFGAVTGPLRSRRRRGSRRRVPTGPPPC